MTKIKIFSMFSGVGGFEIGFEREFGKDMEVVGFSQFEPCPSCHGKHGYKYLTPYVVKCDCGKKITQYASMVLNNKFKGVHNYGDARTIIPERIPDFDILTGGFPCQTFSLAGKREGFGNTRGTLFHEIARVVAVKKPTLLLLENVEGLLSHDKGRTFGVILETLGDLGYILEWQILNAKNFGVPQNRERVFIIGYPRDKGRPKILPITEDDELFNETTDTNESRSQTKIAGTVRKNQNKADGTYISEPCFVSFEDDGIKEGSQISNTISKSIWKGADRKARNQLVKDNNLKQVGAIDPNNKNNPVSGRIYSANGIATTINKGGDGLGAKTGLYAIPNKDGVKVYQWDDNGNQVSIQDRIVDSDGLCTSLNKFTQGVSIKVPSNNAKGYEVAEDGDGINLERLSSKTRRGRVGKGVSQTINKTSMMCTAQSNNIRRLTPRECERLMSWDDDWTRKGTDETGKVVELSDTVRYGLCGNGVVSEVVRHIAEKIKKEIKWIINCR